MKKTMGKFLFVASFVLAAPLAFGQAAPAERTDSSAAQGSKDPAVKQGARQGARDAVNDPVMKCRNLDGVDFLTCIDRAGYGPKKGTASKQNVRADARKQDTDPMQRCHELTGNAKMDCEQQVRAAAKK